MKCVILSCAKSIVPGELFVSGLRLGNIDGQSRLRLVFCTWLYDRTHKGECRTKPKKCQFSFLRKAMCSFFYVSRHFFFTKPTRARGKKNAQRKKNTGSVSQTTWLTKDIPNLCWAQSFFCLLVYQTMIELNQLPRKFDFPCTNVLDLSSRAKNVLEFSTETFINIANAFVLPRSLVRWEARPRFRFQTKHISWCFCQSKTSLLSAVLKNWRCRWRRNVFTSESTFWVPHFVSGIPHSTNTF